MPDDTKAQDQINQAVGTSEKPKVEEHPISEVDAKKYAGQGDFAMPVSPLDELQVPTEGEAAKDAAKKDMVHPIPGAAAPSSGSPMKPLAAGTDKVEPVAKPFTPASPAGGPTKPDTAQPMPQPKEDLEKKAKELLKATNSRPTVTTTTGGTGSKPKKKRGSAVTKLALAAVLVVLMGAGGYVGVNLLNMQQSAEIRQQAAFVEEPGCRGTASGTECNADNDGKCTCKDFYEIVICRGGRWEHKNNCVNPARCGGNGCVTPDETPPPSGGGSCNYPSNIARNGVCDYNSGYSNNPCDRSAPNGSGFGCRSTSQMRHFVCDGLDSTSQGCGYDNGEEIWSGSGTRRFTDRDCGMEQIDAVGGWISIKRDKPCGGGGTPTPSPSPSATPVAVMCDHITPQGSRQLSPGQMLNIQATATAPASRFWLIFYNPDNLADTQDDRTARRVKYDGAEYFHVLPANGPYSQLQTTATFTVSYEQLFRPDENWNGRVPDTVSFQAFIDDAAGVRSGPNGACVGEFNRVTVTSPPPSTAPSPISCVDLTSNKSSYKVGETVTLTCTSSGPGITYYEFQYKTSTTGANWTPVSRSDIANNVATVEFPQAASYIAQCRACKADGTCTMWAPTLNVLF